MRSHLLKSRSRPLVWSLVSTHLPISIIPHEDGVVRVLICVLIVMGVTHHTYFQMGDFWHNADRMVCWCLIVTTLTKNIFSYQSRVYYACFALVVFCHVMNLNSPNQKADARTWRNIGNLKWHILMHIFSSIGILCMMHGHGLSKLL